MADIESERDRRNAEASLGSDGMAAAAIKRRWSGAA
jgi:hypothetical protein